VGQVLRVAKNRDASHSSSAALTSLETKIWSAVIPNWQLLGVLLLLLCACSSLCFLWVCVLNLMVCMRA
jgi:hypothetical protein